MEVFGPLWLAPAERYVNFSGHQCFAKRSSSLRFGSPTLPCPTLFAGVPLPTHRPVYDLIENDTCFSRADPEKQFLGFLHSFG
jgi:hypothetical protein